MFRQFRELLEAINLLKRYDYIILSCGDMFAEAIYDVSKLADRCLMITGETRMRQKRLELLKMEVEGHSMMEGDRKVEKKFFEISGDAESLVKQAMMLCG